MAEKNVVVKVDNITKKFRIPLEASSGIKQKLINILKGRKGYRIFTPLKNISFEVHEGDFFGIVGRNGSGKSTLLKTIAGIYTPNGGAVHINGKLVPFIELGVGFNPELTGRENIFLNGALLGFSHKEMEAMYDEIVDFAELGDFMEERLKNYSSGMQVRLAFSIAIKAKGDILILDEVLAVGDQAFQKKCFDYFDDLKKDGKTVILVTHDMESVKRFCTRALLLEEGHIKILSSPGEVANQYSLDNIEINQDKTNTRSNFDNRIKKLIVRPISSLSLSSDDFFEFEVEYELNEDIEVDLGISFIHQGQSIIEHNTKGLNIGSKKDKLYSIKYKLPLNNFNPIQLQLDVAIFERKYFTLMGFRINACSLLINSEDKEKGGILSKRGKWIQ